MAVDLFESVAECGCAAKVPAPDLAGMLRGVEVPTSPAVLVGPDTLDDAGVYQLSGEQCLVQTLDFFPPVAPAAGADRLADQAQTRRWQLGSPHRHAFRRLRRLRRMAQKALDDAVFQAVKADHCQSTTGLEQAQRLWQHCLDLRQFPIDDDAQRLEGARRRV
jgi:hypothetical protein